MLSVKPIGPVLAVQLNWTRSVSSPSKLAPPMMPNGTSPLTPSYCDSNKPAVNPPRVTYARSAQIVATTPRAESPRKLMTLVNMPHGHRQIRRPGTRGHGENGGSAEEKGLVFHILTS